MLATGIDSYERGKFEECVERFRLMLTPGSPKALQDQVLKSRGRMYFGACLIGLEKPEEAKKQFKILTLDDPEYIPDVSTFPGKVLEVYNNVRESLKEELERLAKEKLAAEQREKRKMEARLKLQQQRKALLLKMAGEETLLHKNSRWIATLPFGIGQFQNNQKVMGWLFLSSETLLGGASIVSALIESSIRSNFRQGQDDRDDAQKNIDLATTVNRVTFGSFVGVALLGIVHAHWTYVPEFKSVQKRELPKELEVIPHVSVLPGQGGFVGLRGSF
jgi:hypothetical protein